MSPRYFHSCMETVSQPLLPPPPPIVPPHCLHLCLMQTVPPWYGSTLHWSTITPCTSRVRRGRSTKHLLVEEAWQPTDGRQHQRERAWASGKEFWRESQTKDEEGTKTGGCWGCARGLKTGRMEEEEVYEVKWHDLIIKDLSSVQYEMKENVKLKEADQNSQIKNVGGKLNPECWRTWVCLKHFRLKEVLRLPLIGHHFITAFTSRVSRMWPR